jgi:uncharacterized protein (DUF427 family)
MSWKTSRAVALGKLGGYGGKPSPTRCIPLGGQQSVNAVWTYEAPYAAVAAIKDHVAFYPDRVDAIEERRV